MINSYFTKYLKLFSKILILSLILLIILSPVLSVNVFAAHQVNLLRTLEPNQNNVYLYNRQKIVYSFDSQNPQGSTVRPKEIVFLIDDSDSMENRIKGNRNLKRYQAMREAAIRFINAIRARQDVAPVTTMYVVTFNSRAELRGNWYVSGWSNWFGWIFPDYSYTTSFNIGNSAQFDSIVSFFQSFVAGRPNTNEGDALRHAYHILNNGKDSDKYVVLFSDGRANKVSWTEENNKTKKFFWGNIGEWFDLDGGVNATNGMNYACWAADNLRNSGLLKGAYNIALLSGNTERPSRIGYHLGSPLIQHAALNNNWYYFYKGDSEEELTNCIDQVFKEIIPPPQYPSFYFDEWFPSGVKPISYNGLNFAASNLNLRGDDSTGWHVYGYLPNDPTEQFKPANFYIEVEYHSFGQKTFYGPNIYFDNWSKLVQKLNTPVVNVMASQFSIVSLNQVPVNGEIEVKLFADNVEITTSLLQNIGSEISWDILSGSEFASINSIQGSLGSIAKVKGIMKGSAIIRAVVKGPLAVGSGLGTRETTKTLSVYIDIN